MKNHQRIGPIACMHSQKRKLETTDSLEKALARNDKAEPESIDQFANTSETAFLLLKTTQNVANRERVNSVLAKLHRNKYAREDAAKSALFHYLRDLVSEVLLGVASESLREERIDKWLKRDSFDTAANIQQQQRPRANRIFKTFDKDLKDRVRGAEKTLKSIISEHCHVVKEIQHVKEKYWSYHRKCLEFPSALKEAFPTQNPFEEPPKSKLSESDIKKIRTSFSSNVKKASELWHKLENMQAQEKSLRVEMERECRAYRKIVFQQIYVRLGLGLEALRFTVENHVRDSFWRGKLLDKIDALDARGVVDTIIEASTWSYVYPQNMSCVNEHGLEATIPDPSRQNSSAGLPKIDSTHDKQCYVELLSDTTAESSGFIKGQQGSVIKRKVTMDGATIEYGWTRPFPWSMKKWGFFNKETVGHC